MRNIIFADFIRTSEGECRENRYSCITTLKPLAEFNGSSDYYLSSQQAPSHLKMMDSRLCMGKYRFWW